GECLLIAAQSVSIDVAFEVGREVYDAFASLLDEVLGHGVARFKVVNDDACAVRMFKDAVKKDDGYILIEDDLEMCVIFRVVGQRDEESVYACIEHGFDVD